MAFEAIQFQLLRNNVLRINHPSLPTSPSIYITAANLAGATSLTIRDNAGFSNSDGGDLLLVGELGEEETEIIYVNGAITAGTALTTSALIFAHPINTPVRKIVFDKIEIFGNTSAVSAGSTSITTINIDPTSPYTEVVLTATQVGSYTYYGIRGVRSVATTYNGGYSDFISASGFSTNTVGFIIDQAFLAVGEKVRPNGLMSRQWAYDQIFLGEQDVAQELKKWSWLQSFNYNAGAVTLGVNSFTLPTNIVDANTPKGILGLRVGQGKNLRYMSKSEYDFLFQNTTNTTVGTSYIAGATSIVLTDSDNFDDSASINVYNAGVIDSVTYTTNTRSTNTLTGVTSNDSGGTAADPVWQRERQGIPSRFTVYQGSGYFDTVPDTSDNLVGEQILLDYYKQVTRVNSDGD